MNPEFDPHATAAPPNADLFDTFPGASPRATSLDTTGKNVESETTFSSKPPQIGRYEILGIIARGGMGVVYKARHQTLDRIAAVKLILSGTFADSADRERFRGEAKIAAQLDHPGIVPLYEVGEENSQPFLAMAFIDGHSLWQEVKESPLPPQRAAGLMRQIAEAIQYAHDRGIVHRDLKPQNILLTKDGQPKVTDFGLAKRQESDATLTETGQPLGTPSYMPPEQARGELKQIGRHSDVYSLGATLYCLLTSRPPFQAAKPIETMLQVVEQEPVSPRALNPLIPKDLETICLKCLEKDPAKRYDSARSLAEELARFERGEPIQARPVSRLERTWRWCRRNPLVAGLMFAATFLMATVAGVSSVAYVRELGYSQELTTANEGLARSLNSEKLATRRALSEVYVNQIARTEAELQAGRFDEARQLLGIAQHEFRGWEHDYLALQVEGTPRSLEAHQQPIHTVAFNADGTMAATASEDGTAKLWNLSTGSLGRGWRSQKDLISTAYSAERKSWLTVSRDWTVTEWNEGGDVELRRISIAAELPSEAARSAQIAISACGGRIAIVSHRVSDSAEVINEIPTAAAIIHIFKLQDSSATSMAVDSKKRLTCIAFSPDERRIVSGAADGEIEMRDAETGELLLSMTQEGGAIQSVCMSPDGTQIAAVTSGSLVLRDALTRRLIFHLPETTDAVTSFAFSPDGAKLVTGGESGWIRLWDAKTGDERSELKGLGKAISAISVSPDCAQIAAASSNGQLKIWHVPEFSSLAQIEPATSEVSTLVFDAPGTRLTSILDSKELVSWDVVTGRMCVIRSPAPRERLISASMSGNRIYTASQREPANKIKLEMQTPISQEELSAEQLTDGRVSMKDVMTGLSKQLGEFFDVMASRTAPIQLKEFQWDKAGLVELDSRTIERPAVETAGQSGFPFEATADFSHDGETLAVVVDRQSVLLIDRKMGSVLHRLSLPDQAPHTLLFRPDGQLLAGLCGTSRSVRSSSPSGTTLDSVVLLWEPGLSDEPFVLRGHEGDVLDISFSFDNTRVATASTDKTVKVWDIATRQEVLTLRGHAGPVTSVAFHPDNRRLASASDDKKIKLWDCETGAELLTLRGHDQIISRIAFDTQGVRLASAAGKQVKIWDSAMPRKRTIMKGHRGRITVLAVDPLGTRLVSGSEDRTLKFWNLRDGTEMATLTGHETTISAFAFSPDGRQFATGAEDGACKLWNAETGTATVNLQSHSARIRAIAFHPEGKHLAIADERHLKVWDCDANREIFSRRSHFSGIDRVAFSTTGNQVFCGHTGRQVLVWTFPGFQRIEPAPDWPPTENRNEVSLRVSADDFDVVVENTSAEETLSLWTQQAVKLSLLKKSWHETNAEDAEQRKDWFAANYHLKRRETLSPAPAGGAAERVQ